MLTSEGGEARPRGCFADSSWWSSNSFRPGHGHSTGWMGHYPCWRFYFSGPISFFDAIQSHLPIVFLDVPQPLRRTEQTELDFHLLVHQLLVSKLWNCLSLVQDAKRQKVSRTISWDLWKTEESFGKNPGSVLSTTRSGKTVKEGSIADNARSLLTLLTQVTATYSASFSDQSLIMASSGGLKGFLIRPQKP